MAARLRVVFFGEYGSTFSLAHYAVLRAHADILLWVAGHKIRKRNPRRHAFLSWADVWERLLMRAGLEWRAVRLLGRPLAGLSVETPIRLMTRDDAELANALREIEPDLIVSAGFSRLLSPAILNLPRLGAFNCHPSPLPRYAGSNPWFWILRNGERESAVTIHRMVAEADAGGIVKQERFAIAPNVNHQQLYNESSVRSAELLIACVARWIKGIVEETPQDLRQRSFYPAPKDGDHRIAWTQSAEQIRNLVRASQPAPGAWATNGNQRFIVRHARVVQDSRRDAGTIVRLARSGLWVACGEQTLEIAQVQADGKLWSRGQIAHALGLKEGDRLGRIERAISNLLRTDCNREENE